MARGVLWFIGAAVIAEVACLSSLPRGPQPDRAAQWKASQEQILRKLSMPTPPPGILGPPAHFKGLEAGTSLELSVSREDALHGCEVTFGVRKLAERPAAFYLRGLLTDDECDNVIADAQSQTMTQAVTAGGQTRSGCKIAWLPINSNRVAQQLAAVCGELLLTPDVTDESGWGEGAGFENLQVLHYETGGEFKLHHDANLETPRILTVLIYLNGKGQTWWPLATDDPIAAARARNPGSRNEALQACHGRTPGGSGLIVTPNKGDAVAFYNYVDDGSGKIDRLAFHAGLPAQEPKDVATLWYQLKPPSPTAYS